MSELINKNDNRATIRWKLLTTASAVALTAYVASSALAKAEDTDRPTIWIELGGQMDVMSGLSSPFTAPFMSAPQGPPNLYHGDTILRQITPWTNVFNGISFSGAQHAPRYAFGGEAEITFQPQDSDWIFSAGIRYGRSHGKRHEHNQTKGIPEYFYTYSGDPYATVPLSRDEFVDITAPSSEHHMIIDFSAGRDVGIGLLGRNGSSNVNAGVRLVNLAEASSLAIFARPHIDIRYPGPKYTLPQEEWNAYTMMAHSSRSFRGVGPSLSWNASAVLAGNMQDGALMADWSVNAALLFGRQKAKTDHSTMATHYYHSAYRGALYPSRSRNNPLRSRRVTVPNVGGSVGLSVKYPNVKFSVGYRYDTFLNAMDTGIDATKKSNLTFQGPYASISFGLGD